MGQPTTSHPRSGPILALVLAAECMDLLDGTIVNVAGADDQDRSAGQQHGA